MIFLIWAEKNHHRLHSYVSNTDVCIATSPPCYMSVMLQGSLNMSYNWKHALSDSSWVHHLLSPGSSTASPGWCLYGNTGVHHSLGSSLLEERWSLMNVDRWQQWVKRHVWVLWNKNEHKHVFDQVTITQHQLIKDLKQILQFPSPDLLQ